MVQELTEGTTTRVRNQTAGYITRTVKLNQAQNVDEGEVIEDTDEE
jgi:ribosomal protein S17E